MIQQITWQITSTQHLASFCAAWPHFAGVLSHQISDNLQAGGHVHATHNPL
jgi:hypothetical protein